MFRSRVAEACFNKFNKNKNFQAKSAGIFKSTKSNPNQQKLARKFGLDIGNVSKNIDTNLLGWTDLIIIVADDVPKDIFKYYRKYLQKVVIWKIKDKNSNIELIIKKVKDLLNKLEKEK